MSAKTLPKQDLSLKDQAYRHIKKLVLNEEIPVNSFISERGLAERLGMSKTPVRLAIERLESEGFVRVSPQQGIVVVALSFEEILDFIEYRLALECFVVRHIAGTLTKEQIKVLEASLVEQSQAMKQGNCEREALVLSDMAFHRMLAGFKGNRQILHALERQQDMLYRVANWIYQRYPVRSKTSFDEHDAIARAVFDGEEDKAVRLMHGHIQEIKALLIGSTDR